MTAWEDPADMLDAKRAAARAMGGPERLARVHLAGRLDARQRIDALCDTASFVELGALGGHRDGAPADAFVCGSATIDGRPVLVGSEDGTVQGGSIGPAGSSKRERLARLAGQERVPLVMMLDGAGHRVTNTLVRRNPAPTDLAALADLSGVVPVLCAVMGPSAGHGALTAPLADVVVMVEGTSQLFTAGPPLVKAATGEDIDKETLGGASLHAESGVAHLVCEDDGAALAALRRTLSYFPLNAWERPPRTAAPPAPPEPPPPLTAIVPADLRRPYDMRRVLAAVFDAGSLHELQPAYGPALLTFFARLDGHAVAVVANQPKVRAGAIDADAAAKGAAFVELARCFHFPVVLLADNPGVLPGAPSERAGILGASARLFAAQHRHPGPKLHVTLRKAFGFGSSVMAQNPFSGQTLTLAFPTAIVGAMPARGGTDAAKTDAATADRLQAAEAGGPWRLADTLTYDDVIHPDELRPRLLHALTAALRGRATEAPAPHRVRGRLP